MTEKFDLQVVKVKLTDGLVDNDDFLIINYLESYEELNKFFNLMGTVFGFVSKDLRQKMDILYKFHNDPSTTAHFKTCKSMILYEKENNLLHKKGYVSGSRTLLRLHRGLEFIREFLLKIQSLNDNDDTGAACKEVYENTLAKYHTFLIRNGAKLAMHTIPNRSTLLQKVCAGEEDIAKALGTLPDALDVMKKVYDRAQELYTIHDLHSLP